ncbi:MAG: hypothetical protein HETSPECPRED_006353 [Heterodermia speciosa]|uniref:Uncharacterized protein n=1 Tax=Heterodermia speciosa TaxID=116794 RepID=A0A8H3IFV6_9LECA|nr:MAG: hypothetical protein HETSPECPRED_006353 [Heterodermia speciosa]
MLTSRQRSQSINPLFKAKHAQRADLQLEASSWQLQGLAADARTSPQELSSLTWNHSTSSAGDIVVAAEQPVAEPYDIASSHSSSSRDKDANNPELLSVKR